MPTKPIRTAVGGMIAMAAAMGIGRFVYTPILPFMTDALSLTASEAGLIAAANFLGYLGGALAGATGLLHGDRRRWLLAALAGSALTTGAMALAVSVPAFLVLRFAGGVCSALAMVFGSALVFDRLTAAGRPDLSHVHFAGVGAGMAVSAVTVAALAGSSVGWAGQWTASALIAFAALAALVLLVPPGPGDTVPPAAPAGPKKQIDRRLYPLAVSYGLFGFGYVITATFISVLVRQTPALAPVEPVVWLIVGIAAVPSVALWTWVGRRTGNPVAIALACLVEAAGIAATVLFHSAAAVLVGGALLGGTFMGITALGLITAREISLDRSGRDPRRMLALMTAAFGAGQMVGPAFGGYAASLTGSFTAPSLIAAVMLLLAAGLALAARK